MCSAGCCEIQNKEDASFDALKNAMTYHILYFEFFIPHSAGSVSEKKRKMWLRQ